ncbi:MAG: hypothetical protein LBB61_00540 [Treponema sp.]|jgi:hypothetical protein|nr:hypothetical protein [Treponema sp.]
MPTNRDRFSKTRTGQLAAEKNWVIILKVNAAAWNIPATAPMDMETQTNDAEAALAAAQNEDTRTPVATAQCRGTFKLPEDAMRDIKKRYFYVPPLRGQRPHQFGAEAPRYHRDPGRNPYRASNGRELPWDGTDRGIRILYVTGNAGDAVNKGYRIWYGVIAHGEIAPANPDDLRKSFSPSGRRT